jgi:hypothetical protein
LPDARRKLAQLAPAPARLYRWGVARVSRRSLLTGSAALLGAAVTTRATHALGARRPVPAVPLLFSVALASEGGAPVCDAAWVEAQLAEMETLFGPIGVHAVEVGSRTINARHANLETRADRDALAAEVRPGVVNVFVVGSLMDVDEPPRMRRGVHWRVLARPKTRYVILASEAMPTVLAHEMGHYYGNGHSQVVDNLMSYERTGGPLHLDDWQKHVIEEGARRAFASGELLPADRVERG